MLTKITDRYVLQKFVKEFEKVLAFVYTPGQLIDGETSELSHTQEALTAPLNYLRFKEFLIEMCFMTEQQATSDSHENTLSFELWELIAPKVSREFGDMSGEEEEALDKLDQAYITQM